MLSTRSFLMGRGPFARRRWGEELEVCGEFLEYGGKPTS